ncbi:hypothetical protein [Pelagibius sp.]|uniref:hypothetical protein n=1 Tax=Pelagibius sp. TaxID=1931238 RepID=UPI002639F3CF|nr:hypothetical protein [Pelagibius sp.]
MAKTYSEQLDEVQTAIAKIEAGGQSWSIGNRSFTRADLGELYQREERLTRLVRRESRGGIGVKRAVPDVR